MAQRYSAITADIVASTDHYASTGQALRPRLLAAIDSINRRFADDLAVPFDITLGDEFQGLAADLSACPQIIQAIRLELTPLRCRVGVGIGEVASEIMPSTREMEGPAFTMSRDAIEEAKDSGRMTIYRVEDSFLEMSLNSITMLIDVLEAKRTAKQWEAVKAYVEHGNLAAAGEVLGISTQAVEQRIGAANWRNIEKAVGTMSQLLAQTAS